MNRKTAICVSLMGKNRIEIMRELNWLLGKEFDYLEWRADAYQTKIYPIEMKRITDEIRKVFADKKLLFTFLARESCEEYRQAVYTHAIQSGYFDAIDLDGGKLSLEKAGALIDKAKNINMETILSWHEFSATPSHDEMLEKSHTMIKADPHILKLAFQPKDKEEVIRLLSVISRLQSEYPEKGFVGIAMGELGQPSRWLADWLGMALQYAGGKTPSAPGQLTLEEISKWKI